MAEPVALAPEPGRQQCVGAVSPAAEAFGVVPGMRLGEALSRCPELRLVPPDPEATRSYWAGVLDRVEALGAAVECDAPGVAWFEADGLRRLHGGHLEGVLAAARRALPPGVRLGAATSRFAAYAAALHGRRGKIVTAAAVGFFLAPLPVGLLRSRAGLEELPEMLERLGIRTLGALAALPSSRIAERFGHPGLLAFELACGRDARLEPRRPAEPLVERLALPEAASGMQLERTLELLVARVLGRRERRGRSLGVLALSARFVEGGTWRVSVALRTPSVDARRVVVALAPRLASLPAPAESLGVEVEAFGPAPYDQVPLVYDPAELRRARLGEAVRHVRSATGEESLMRVLEVDPDSRLPERRAVLAPYSDMSGP
jgi:protein ImuB